MLLEMVVREEQIKIRDQIADDFHEIGNKLTRILLLVDVFETNLFQQNNEQKQILSQIKGNTHQIYRDTKDILWSLEPQNQNLYEIMYHIKYLAIDIFNNTKTHLKFENFETKNNLNLSYVMSHNIYLIFKEILYKIFAQSKAGMVTLTSLTDENEIKLVLFDSGNSFYENSDNNMLGLDKIETRAKNINGKIEIETQKGKGTKISLSIKCNELICN
jgi:signal transduction histidine kinase